jgi:hypothetical protein
MHRLTGANVRVTIVEFGFLDNAKDFALLDTLAEREVFYEAVVRAVCVDEGKTYKAPAQAIKPVVKPVIKPVVAPSRGVYRVFENDKQVGAYSDPTDAIKDALKRKIKNIRIELI